MDKQDKIQVKLSGSPEDIGEWDTDLQQMQGQVSISSRSQERDPTALNFGLVEVAALVTIMTFGFYSLELVTKIYVTLQRNKKQKNAKTKVIIVETPLGRSVFTATDNLSKEQIKEKLDALVKAHE